MKALGRELFQPFVEHSGTLLKVSRIYRDARMHHPVPYKESLWLCIRQDVAWWGEHPCLFLEINPEGIDYGFFIWQPKVATMEAFRREIAARPDAFLEIIRTAEETTGMPITAECYKRPKQTEDPRLAPYFAWKRQIGCIRHEDFGPETFSPALTGRVADFFAALTPVFDYFNRF
jgi:uncharacterized protein (DUF2461 family)